MNRRGAGFHLGGWRGAAVWVAVVALATGCQPFASSGPRQSPRADPVRRPASSTRGGREPALPSSERGLSTATAFVTVSGPARSVLLTPTRAGAVIDAVWRIVGDVPDVAVVAGGPRVLAAVRLNEQVVDVAVWKPQALVVGPHRLSNVSGIVIPVTGRWRHHVLIVQGARVVASPRLNDSLALAAIDDTVQTAIGPR